MNLEKIMWYKTLKKYSRILIFGATDNARATYSYVKDAGADIECYVVSERKDNPFYLDSKQVKTFNEIREDIKKHGLIIVSQIYKNNSSMESILFENGFKNIISSPTQITGEITEELNKYCQTILGKNWGGVSLMQRSLIEIRKIYAFMRLLLWGIYIGKMKCIVRSI